VLRASPATPSRRSRPYNDASNASNFHPRLPRYGRLTHDQDRTGITGSFQWRPDGHDAPHVRLPLFEPEGHAPGGLPRGDLLQPHGGAGRQAPDERALHRLRNNGALLFGTYNGVDVRSESRYDELETTFNQPTLSFEHEFSPTLKLTGKIGQADSKFRNPVQTTTTLDALNVNGYAIDFRDNDRLPIIRYPFDPAQAGRRPHDRGRSAGDERHAARRRFPTRPRAKSASGRRARTTRWTSPTSSSRGTSTSR
jgi:hypothetical protein